LQLSQIHPQLFPPNFSQEIPETQKIAENNTQNFPGNPGNPTKSQKITPSISKEIPEIHKITGNH